MRYLPTIAGNGIQAARDLFQLLTRAGGSCEMYHVKIKRTSIVNLSSPGGLFWVSFDFQMGSVLLFSSWSQDLPVSVEGAAHPTQVNPWWGSNLCLTSYKHLWQPIKGRVPSFQKCTSLSSENSHVFMPTSKCPAATAQDAPGFCLGFCLEIYVDDFHPSLTSTGQWQAMWVSNDVIT